MSEAIAFDTHRLATKQNLQELKSDLLKWMIGALVAQTGMIVGLVLGFMGT